MRNKKCVSFAKEFFQKSLYLSIFIISSARPAHAQLLFVLRNRVANVKIGKLSKISWIGLDTFFDFEADSESPQYAVAVQHT